jgi:type IV secretion system protein VirB6
MDSSALGMASSLLDWLNFKAAGLPNMVFFSEINDFLDDEIAEFAGNLLKRSAKLIGGVALTVVTWWIIYQGYRIVTGQSREPMMALVVNSLKAVLIVGIAIGAAAGAGSTYQAVTDGLNTVVRKTVTGDEGAGSYADIDKTLAIMQVALEVIDSVDTGDDVLTDKNKDRALLFTGVGLGGPAIMAATALLLNKIAMALIIGLGPIFILCLLFDQTKQLFSKWLYFGIGTLFSMAFLTVMVTLALDMVIAVGMAFWATGWLTGGQESLTSMAMQQGGLGLVLSMLIISAPPMAALFFQGVMGQFSGYNAFAGQASPPGSGVPPQTIGYTPPPPNGESSVGSKPGLSPVLTPTVGAATEPAIGQRGLAKKGPL